MWASVRRVGSGRWFGAVCVGDAGLAVGASGEVLDADGDAIAGRYASGCAAGRPGTGANGGCCYAAAMAWLAAEAMTGALAG